MNTCANCEYALSQCECTSHEQDAYEKGWNDAVNASADMFK